MRLPFIIVFLLVTLGVSSSYAQMDAVSAHQGFTAFDSTTITLSAGDTDTLFFACPIAGRGSQPTLVRFDEALGSSNSTTAIDPPQYVYDTGAATFLFRSAVALDSGYVKVHKLDNLGFTVQTDSVESGSTTVADAAGPLSGSTNSVKVTNLLSPGFGFRVVVSRGDLAGASAAVTVKYVQVQ